MSVKLERPDDLEGLVGRRSDRSSNNGRYVADRGSRGASCHRRLARVLHVEDTVLADRLPYYSQGFGDAAHLGDCAPMAGMIARCWTLGPAPQLKMAATTRLLAAFGILAVRG